MPHPVLPHRRSRAPFYCLGLLAALAACEMLGPAEALPSGAMLLIAPPEYEAWWTATEACAGESSDFQRIEWYVVPDVRTFPTTAGEKVGLWSHSSDGMRIILAGDYADNELVVRHEMLHALLDRNGHPAEYFQERCHLTWESWHPGE
ncbi:MAG: hypothetical protein SGJ01_06695 [Gemmatimonadota bacterium]|nr:hypothetical protein [Gemmatimonadota bacterium]